MLTLFVSTLLLTPVELLISAQYKIQRAYIRIPVPAHSRRG
jgi:hypothetical protein